MTKIKFFNSGLSIAVASTIALNAGVNMSDNTKDIKIRVSQNSEVVIEQTNQNVKKKGFVNLFRASKAKFQFMEPIKFQLKLNKDAYVYIWTVNRSRKGYLILPNKYEHYNKYKKDKLYVIPPKSSDFEYISDLVGTEHVYLLATSKKDSIKKIKKIFSKKVGGKIYATQDEEDLNKYTKDIIIRAKKHPKDYEIRELNITIVPSKR